MLKLRLVMATQELFSEFREVSAKEWKQRIQVDLRGADYNETLVWESPEGIKVKPFYHSDETGAGPEYPKNKRNWRIGHDIYAGDSKRANKKALQLLQKGVERLSFSIPSPDIPIATLLEGIDIARIPVYLNLGFLSSDYLRSAVAYSGQALKNIYLNIDPIGQLARSGNWFRGWDTDFKVLKEVLETNAEHVLAVDLGLYQNAGAHMVQQLAYALAHANEYLNACDEWGFPGPKSITFKVAVGSHYFFEIAKLRALRELWSALTEAYGIQMECHIIAYPTRRNKTLYAYNTNMLRTTTECMAAVLGGADMVMNLPYDAIYHKANEFGDRIALNQLLLLKNESYFDKVRNPADGAYYIENITQQLAEKALVLFKSIEKGGGFLKQLKAHTIQKKIGESAQKEKEELNQGKEVLVGTNKYQHENDRMKDAFEIYPFIKRKPRKTLIQPILEKRLVEEVEQKRLANE